MAKELPYFKFYPSEWLKGDITLCSITAQGLFINICTYYWMKDCSMSLTSVEHRFKDCSTYLEEMIDLGIIKIEDGNIIIDFLDEQMENFVDVNEKRRKAGLASAAKRNKCSTNVQQDPNNIDKIREEKRKEEINIVVNYLNDKTGKNFKNSSRVTKDKIKARLNEKYTVDDFKKVIDNKVSEWKGTDMDKYLRPETLFSPKFESYLNQKPKIDPTRIVQGV